MIQLIYPFTIRLFSPSQFSPGPKSTRSAAFFLHRLPRRPVSIALGLQRHLQIGDLLLRTATSDLQHLRLELAALRAVVFAGQSAWRIGSGQSLTFLKNKNFLAKNPKAFRPICFDGEFPSQTDAQLQNKPSTFGFAPPHNCTANPRRRPHHCVHEFHVQQPTGDGRVWSYSACICWERKRRQTFYACLKTSVKNSCPTQNHLLYCVNEPVCVKTWVKNKCPKHDKRIRKNFQKKWLWILPVSNNSQIGGQMPKDVKSACAAQNVFVAQLTLQILRTTVGRIISWATRRMTMLLLLLMGEIVAQIVKMFGLK